MVVLREITLNRLITKENLLSLYMDAGSFDSVHASAAL